MKINRSQAADIFGVAKTTVDAWRKSGCPVESEGGRGVAVIFDSADLFQWLLNGGDNGGKNYADLLDKEKLRKLQRENDLAEGQIAPIDILRESLAAALKPIASILDALPLTMKKRNPNLNSKDIELVRKEIAKCRNMAVKAAIDEATS